MQVIKCPACGEEILQIPEVKAMRKALKKHLEKHPVDYREKIESDLILQIFKNAAGVDYSSIRMSF